MYFHETHMINRWWNWITDRPIAIYILLLGVAVCLVVLVSFPDYYNSEFWKNIRVEAHGMLFDILVLGLLFSWLHGLGEKRRLIKRYEDEIDDFRGWKSEEAARRIRGNILRLNREGVHKINLEGCYLRGADLEGANLMRADLNLARLDGARLDGADLSEADLRRTDFSEADLRYTDLRYANLSEAYLNGASFEDANFEGAILSKAYLKGASFKEANFKEAMMLTIEQLCEAETLYLAKLDPELESQVKERCPHLLENPDKPDKADE